MRQVNQTNFYQGISRVPLLIAMDAEWGLGMRLDSTISYPRQMMLGALNDNRLIYHMGADIARQLKRIGVHVNFAPVVDINNNPLNPVINTRAFGEDRDDVTQKGLAYMLGLQDNGVLACAKHFPGHGDTDSDSHYTLPLLKHSAGRIDSLELYPFRQLIASGVASVMTAHLEIPNLEPKPKLAASLSSRIVTNLLIDSLGFRGLIFTDALNMKGVSDYYKPVELNLMALEAGNDILLFPSEVKASISRIEREVKRGNFPEEEINRRCRKILEAKYRVGLNRWQPIPTQGLVADLNSVSSELLIRQITEDAITVLNGSQAILPIKGLDTLSIAYVQLGGEIGDAFREQLELYAPISTYVVERNATAIDLRRIENDLTAYNLVIVGYHTLTVRPSRDYGVTAEIAQFIADINGRNRVVLVLFGTPYALDRLTDVTSLNEIVVAYDNSPLTQNLVAQMVFGGIGANGTLPVSLSGGFPKGSGTSLEGGMRFKYSIPEELGISSEKLRAIDSIALNAISQEATPGMQILAAKDGVVFYHKSFGSYTYTYPQHPVDNKSVYDVASLTKIVGTMPKLMDLYSRGALSLDAPIGSYLQFPYTSAVEGLTVRNILLHQAGLQAWIPFYQRTLLPYFASQPLFQSTLSPEYPFRLGPQRFLNRNSALSAIHFNRFYSFSYPVEVAHGLFASESIRDSIFRWILQTPLNNQGTYLYSDLGFIMLPWAMGNITGIPLETYLRDNFFAPLGMNLTGFKPLDWVDNDRIAPTENDLYFRKQLLWGHVHDPAAAMLGGIAGHAGLFSTANDLAKMMQMFLNNGGYGGRQYLPEETISLFTSCVNCQNGVRRGLGFDKPEPDPNRVSPVSRLATSLSFGHTGFTGVVAWADPAYDLVYILLSNRIHPDADNRKLITMEIRTKIQDAIYRAIQDK